MVGDKNFRKADLQEQGWGPLTLDMFGRDRTLNPEPWSIEAPIRTARDTTPASERDV